MVLPTWNKEVLDRSIGRALSRADPTRPVVPHSGVFPGPLQEGTDSHLYFGWYRGRMADLAPAIRRWPRLARFVSEFGAQAVPETAGFMEPERWPHLDWPRLILRHNLQKGIFDRLVPPDEHGTFESWRAATQEYQAALVQLQIEDLRRIRYRPTGGFLHFCFADGHAGVTWSVLDHERRPKAAFAALRDACRSVLPLLDPRTGAVHLANELRRPVLEAVVTVRIDDRTWSFGGDLPGDSLVYVGRVDMPPQPASAEVTLTQAELGCIANTYGPVVLGSVRPSGTPRTAAERPGTSSGES
jgi:beta-mannosidase